MTGTTYLVLLKGVNVGRAKRFLMADFRTLLTGLGYSDVRTVLQSGNAVFGSTDTAEQVSAAVRAGLLADLGVDAGVVVRTSGELVAAVADDPFGELAVDPTRHLLGFFSARPEAARVASFEEFILARGADPEGGELHQIIGQHCYLWCPQGVLQSLFGTVDWDRRLGVTVTMRNFATVHRLLTLAAP